MTMAGNRELDMKKLKAVIHYIVHKCGSAENVGKTVLYKILYFSDFDFFEKYEKSITGEAYAKLPFGPAPRDFNISVMQLKKEFKIKEIEAVYGGQKQIKYISLQEPENSPLTADEIKIIDKTIQKISGMTASQSSSYSHGDMPWKSAKDGDNLDYEMVFYRNNTYSVSDNSEVQTAS